MVGDHSTEEWWLSHAGWGQPLWAQAHHLAVSGRTWWATSLVTHRCKDIVSGVRSAIGVRASGQWNFTARLPKSSETSEVSGYAKSGRSPRLHAA